MNFKQWWNKDGNNVKSDGGLRNFSECGWNACKEEIASEDVRAANSRAIRLRDQWRQQYTELSEFIRELKRKRTKGFQNPFVIRALQAQARDMMVKREHIHLQLVASAYEYV